jgi:hypothetical protein
MKIAIFQFGMLTLLPLAGLWLGLCHSVVPITDTTPVLSSNNPDLKFCNGKIFFQNKTFTGIIIERSATRLLMSVTTYRNGSVYNTEKSNIDYIKSQKIIDNKPVTIPFHIVLNKNTVKAPSRRAMSN